MTDQEILGAAMAYTDKHGGGGGTSNYENLSNQPQINGETLIGDKTGADLGLVDAVEGKGLSTNDYDDNEKAAVAAATSAISAMKDGTDLDSFGDVEVALLDKADTSDLGTAAAKDSTNTVTAGSTDLVESGAVKDAIDAAVSKCYHHAGTKTVAQLTHDLLITANEGNVYEMTDSGTTTSDFMEGIGRPIKTGDNVGVAKISDGVYKFDLLSGFVDTTNFVQKSVTAGLLKNDGTVNDEIEEDVSKLKSGFTALDNEVNGDATTYPYADVITINDAVPANLADCSVKVEPVQDLHGYDKPWVGGAGKNKLPLVLADLKTTNTSGTWSGNAYTYRDVTFTVNTDSSENVISILVNGTASSNAMFRLYENLNESCPFNGYILNGCPANGSINTYELRVSDIDVTSINDLGNGKEINVNSTGKWQCAIMIHSGYNAQNFVFYPMIRVSTESATFAPYTNICPISGHTEAVVTVADDDTDPTVTNTYTLALGDTIYGGTVDFKTGVMMVDRAIVDLSTQSYYESSTNVYATSNTISNIKAPASNDNVANCLCENYEVVARNGQADLTLAVNTNGRIVIADSRFSSKTDFVNALNGVQLCYELATPITVQLTPEQIQLLQGTNTLYASTGDISVTVNGVSGAIGAVQEQANATDNALAQLAADIVDKLPDAPTTDGTYVLTVTVADGAATYSWESAE